MSQPGAGPVRPDLSGLRPIPTFVDRPTTLASDFEGRDLSGAEVSVTVRRPGQWTLLLFLSSDCDGCLPFWQALTDPPAHGLTVDQVVVVAQGSGKGDAAAVRPLVPPQSLALVVTSPEAYTAYRVHGGPFFVLVDGSAPVVATEGVAWGLSQVADDVAAAGLGRR